MLIDGMGVLGGMPLSFSLHDHADNDGDHQEAERQEDHRQSKLNRRDVKPGGEARPNPDDDTQPKTIGCPAMCCRGLREWQLERAEGQAKVICRGTRGESDEAMQQRLDRGLPKHAPNDAHHGECRQIEVG